MRGVGSYSADMKNTGEIHSGAGETLNPVESAHSAAKVGKLESREFSLLPQERI